VLRKGKQFIIELSSDHKLTMGSTTTLKWVSAPITTSCVNISRGFLLSVRHNCAKLSSFTLRLFVLFPLYIIIPCVSDTMPKGDIGDVPS